VLAIISADGYDDDDEDDDIIITSNIPNFDNYMMIVNIVIIIT
jgi:hypothetical protein